MAHHCWSKKYRFWTHHILPLVYDESLSYYEFLCKIYKDVNDMLGTVNEQSEAIKEALEGLTDIDEKIAMKEDISHKVNTINGSSTTEQYPSAKAVFDALAASGNLPEVGSGDNGKVLEVINGAWGVGTLAGKENVSNKVTNIGAGSTDTQYPSAKAVYQALNGIEYAVNKTQNVTRFSTATQYPSAKAVYDIISTLATLPIVGTTDNGKVLGVVDGMWVPTTVQSGGGGGIDVSNTIWAMRDNVNVTTGMTIIANFYSNYSNEQGVLYHKLEFVDDDGNLMYDTTNVYSSGTWNNDSYRKITFAPGTVLDAKSYAWFVQNADICWQLELT